MKKLLPVILLLHVLIFPSCEDENQGYIMGAVSSNSPKPAPAKEEKTIIYEILPKDESGQAASLIDFLGKLEKAVQEMDTAALFSLCSPDIIISHGGGVKGFEAMTREYKLDDTQQSLIWPHLSKILKLGGTFENDGSGSYFCLPYTHAPAAFGRYDYDFNWYTTAVCLHNDVNVYSAPTIKADIISTLKYSIIEVDPDFSKDGYIKINTLDKKIEGFIKSHKIIYASEPCLIIRKINGDWKITAFAPFD